MKKRLLVLGAGRGQVGLIKAAKEMGVTVIVATPTNRPYPGIRLADEICEVDISFPELVYEKAKELHLDGIVTGCLDTPMSALGYCCDRLGLVGPCEAAASLSNNKFLMKKALTSAGVNTARFYQVNDTDELHRAIRELNFPVIVKATDLQGSKGIYIANNMQEAEFGFAEAMSMTRQKYCIVEEFIVGTEFGAEAFVYHGEVLFVLPNGKNTQMGYTAVPVGHYAPMDWSEEVLDKARIVTEKAIKAVGLDNCAVNIDLIERDGEVYVIELTGRMGANCLPELVSIYYQVPYYKMAVMMALGLDPREEFNKRSERGVPNASAMLTSDRDGILSSISCDISDIPGVYELSYFVKKGLRVYRFTNSRDCVGQAIVQGESIEDCFEKLDRIRKNLILELDPLPCD